MAIYHCQVKPVGRGQGRSSTAASAYRSCSRLHDERTGEIHDYTRKRGLEHAEIVLSTEAARKDIQWARAREQLWNAAEAAEVRKDARVAREYEVALPHELTKAERIELVRSYALDLANRYQCAVDFAIHRPHRSGDDRNYHAHILTTTRQVMATGLGAKTFIERSDTDRARLGLGPAKNEIVTVRERWAECANEALEKAQHQERVDHRSLAAQGIDRIPTRHKGPAIRAIEARGEKSRVLERIRTEEARAGFAKLAEIGRVERIANQVRASVIERSGELSKALLAPDATAKSELVEKAKREGLAALRARQAERQKLLERGRDAEKDAGRQRDRSEGLELAKSNTNRKNPKADPGGGSEA